MQMYNISSKRLKTYDLTNLYIYINQELNFILLRSIYIYTEWLVTGGTSVKGVILREKRSQKYRIKIFRLRLCFRENQL